LFSALYYHHHYHYHHHRHHHHHHHHVTYSTYLKKFLCLCYVNAKLLLIVNSQFQPIESVVIFDLKTFLIHISNIFIIYAPTKCHIPTYNQIWSNVIKISSTVIRHFFPPLITYHVNGTNRKETTAQESEVITRSSRHWLLGHVKTNFNQLYVSPCFYVIIN